jgi:hypothetical protein
MSPRDTGHGSMFQTSRAGKEEVSIVLMKLAAGTNPTAEMPFTAFSFADC